MQYQSYSTAQDSPAPAGQLVRGGRGLLLATGLAIALLSGGCTTSGTGSAAGPRGRDCFWENHIQDWQVVDDRTLIVFSLGRRKAHEVSLAGGCYDLDYTPQIAFISRDGRVCGYGGDALIIPRSGGERCTIVAVRELDAIELAERVAPRGTSVGVKSTLILPQDKTGSDATTNTIEATETWGAATSVARYGGLFVAGAPDRDALAMAAERGAGVVINLREPEEMDWDEAAAAAENGLAYYNVPISRQSETFDAAAIDRISALVEQHSDAPIFLHCSSGNRASAWLAIHKVRNEGMALDEALGIVRQTGLTKEPLLLRIDNFLSEDGQ